MLGAQSRVLWLSTWKMIDFVFNGFLFVLIGLELPSVLEGLAGRDLSQLVTYTLAVCAVVILARFVWVYAASRLPNSPARIIARSNPRLAGRLIFVVGVVGPARRRIPRGSARVADRLPGAQPDPADHIRRDPGDTCRTGPDHAVGSALGRLGRPRDRW